MCTNLWRIVLGVGLCLASCLGARADDAGAPNFSTATDGHRGGLGVSLRESGNRLWVSAVQADSPAARAGMRVGDEIVSIDAMAVQTAQQLIAEVVKRQPGTPVALQVRRQGRVQDVQARLVSLDMLRALRAEAEYTRVNQRIRALQRQVSLLEQAVHASGGEVPPAYNGNGDQSWYYQTQPDDPNQGIHDYGARARDGQ